MNVRPSCFLPCYLRCITAPHVGTCNRIPSRKMSQLSAKRSQVAAAKKTNYGACLSNVKNRDYEGFLHCLVFPDNLIRFALAIKAFNVELAMIPDQARYFSFSLLLLLENKSKCHQNIFVQINVLIRKSTDEPRHFYNRSTFYLSDDFLFFYVENIFISLRFFEIFKSKFLMITQLMLQLPSRCFPAEEKFIKSDVLVIV